MPNKYRYCLLKYRFDLGDEKKAASERGAWSYALRTLRQLEKEGFNVFAGFNNNAEVNHNHAEALRAEFTAVAQLKVSVTSAVSFALIVVLPSAV